MALPTTPGRVYEVSALTPELFNLPDQPSLDQLVQTVILRADAWMQGHMGGAYNLLTPAWVGLLQEEGQIYLTLSRLSRALKAEKTYGTHAPYMSEDTAAYERLIDTDWLYQARVALDLWTTVEPVEPHGFAMPVFSATPGVGPSTYRHDPTFHDVNRQYKDELDWARGVPDVDIGSVRR